MPQMPAQGKKRARGGGERVSKAPKMRRSCDACACAKRKCDGQTSCSLCTRKGIPCIYSERQKSGPKRNHIPETAKKAAVYPAGAPTSKGGKAAQNRSDPAAANGSKPKKKVCVGAGAAGAAQAAPATGTATAPDASKKTTVRWQQQQTTHQSLPSPLTEAKSKIPRPRPSVAALITAVSPKSSSASALLPAESSPTDKPKTSTSPVLVPVPAAVRRRKQPRPVAKKEPRPRHQLKNQDGGGRGKDPAAVAEAPAVVTPVACPSAAVAGKDAGIARMSVAPPLPPRLSLSPSRATAAAAAVPSPVKDATQPLSSLLLRDEVLPATALSESGSSIDGASSLSWDDVPDVFLSSLEDDVLWSCDDFSDDGKGGEGGEGVDAEGGDEEHFLAGRLPSELSRGEKMKTVERAVSPTVEMMLLDDPPAPTSSRARGSENPHQLHHREASPMLQQRASSPISPQQAALVEGNGRHQQPVEFDEAMVVGVIPAGSRRSSVSSACSAGSAGTDIGRPPTSVRRFPGDVTSSPISSWTQDAVEAGASTLLAVLADTDGSDGVTGDGQRHGGLQKQQLQQQHHRFQHNQYWHNQHRERPANRSSTTATIGNHNERLSVRWSPQAAPVGRGRETHIGIGSRIFPPTTNPSTAVAFAAVGSRPWYCQTSTAAAPTQQRNGSHHPQRSQLPSCPGEGMTTASKGPWAAHRERNGFKMYHTASL